MERYCSSYVDRNGLYNDGFPCPGQTYCCEKDDGMKMCCQEVSADTIVEHVTKQAYTSPILSQLVTTKSNEFYHNLKKFNNQIQKQSLGTNEEIIKNNEQYTQSSNGYIREPSSISLLMSNPALLLGVCLAFSLLVIITSLLLVCVFRFCNKSTNLNNKEQSKNKKPTKKNTHNKSSHHNLNSDNYSRDSSSSGSSNATSSTSTSPKGNVIIEDEDEESINECQKILTIDPNSHLQNNMRQMLQTANSNLILSNRSSNLNEYLLQTRLNSNNPNHIIHSNYSHTPSHYMNNAMSSGSSSVCTSVLLNNLNANANSANTTQSFVFNSQNLGSNGPNLNFINDFEKDNLADTDDETDPGDFISSTTSNLEFLKSHSLFNSTPLNYYPTLGLTGLTKQTLLEKKETPPSFPQPPVYCEPKQEQRSTPNPPVNIGDFRFSTFLPSNIYSKQLNTELI